VTTRGDAALAAAVAVTCATLYLITLTPGLPHPSGDSHELTTAAAALGIAHRTGYPLFTWLAALFAYALPVGDVAFRTNAMCAVLAAAGVAGVYVLARQLGLRPLVAAFSALLLGVGTTYWSQAVLTEVYAVNVFVMTIQLNLLVAWSRRRTPGLLIAFAFAFGLSPGTHMSNLGLAPTYALFILLVDPGILRRPGTIAAMLAVFLVGLAQFAWLPLRAHTARFPNPTPDTLDGFWHYTLGAFAGSRFAFPLHELPARLALYLRFLAENFTPVGVGVGLLGMWVLLWRDALRFWLVLAVYLTNVVVFSQLAVFDLDVFFLAGYVVFVLFVGFGADALGDALRPVVPATLRTAGAAAVLAVALLVLARGSFAANDRRADTAVDDFQRSLFAMLPPDGVLVAPSGVFAGSVAYYHDVLGLRPDVQLVDRPDAPPPRDGPRFTTLGVVRGDLRPSSRWGLSPDAVPRDAWFVPALVGARQDLMLWRVEPTAPAPIATFPARRGVHAFTGATLYGWTISQPAPDRVHLETHWTAGSPAPVVVGTRIGAHTIESHELGFGMRARRGDADDGRIVESFDLVIPSTLPPGRHPLAVGVTRFDATGLSTDWVEIGHVDVG
jgi:hypothetical protein